MITEKNIIEAYLHLRKTNQTIPDEVLDFIKNTCINKIKNLEVKNYSKYYFIVKVSEKGYEEITQILPSGTYMQLFEKDGYSTVQVKTDVISLIIENLTEKIERIV